MGAKNTKEMPNVTMKNNADNNDRADQKTVNEGKTQQVKVIIHRIVPATNEPKVILHPIAVEEEPEDLDEETDCSGKHSDYQVQSPVSNDSSSEINDHQSKSTTFQIQEILSDATLSSDETGEQNTPIISEMINDLETQVTSPPAFNVTPLNPSSPDSSKTPEYDDLKMKRAQKRAALETHFLPQLLSPRYLDSILEENSDMSDARSDCSDRRSTELCHQEIKVQKVNAKFPRSNLDFSRKHKHGNTLPTLQNPICEEPLALMVETKLIDHLHNLAAEACSTQSTLHLEPQVEAAELVFINSSTSSSTSDLMELEEEEYQEDESLKTRETVDLDTDANEIIMKPNENNEREITPVNQIYTSLECNLTDTTKNKNENEKTSIAISETNVKTKFEGEAINTAISNNNTNTEHISGDEESEQLVLSKNSTIVDTSSLSSVSLSSGHESTITTTSEQHTTITADLMQSFSYDDDIDDSSLVPASSSNSSSTINASPSLSLKSSVEEVEENSEEAFARLENTCREIMDNVREIVYANSEATVNNKISVMVSNNMQMPPSTSSSMSMSHVTDIHTKEPQINGKQLSPSPPPIPPPSREHVYECNDNAKNILPVSNSNSPALLTNIPQQSSIKPVGTLERQESLESHCSSNSTNHSQCTAINLNERGEYDVSSPIFSDNETSVGATHSTQNNSHSSLDSIQKLRQLCTMKLATLPYGEQVLEELANVAQNIGEVKATKILQVLESPSNSHANLHELQSSINKQQQQLQQQQPLEHQKQLHNIEKNREIVHKVLLEDQLLLNSVKTIKKQENSKEERNILRKSLSPPPIPPPPVPMKSSETAAKAQQQQQHQNNNNANSRIIPIVFEENDVSVRNLNTKEQQNTKTFSMNGKKDSRQPILINDNMITKKPQQQEQEEYRIKINANVETAFNNNTTSSVENNSKQKQGDEIKLANTSEKYQQVYTTSSNTNSSSISSSKQQFKEENTHKYFPNSKEETKEKLRQFGEMQGVESELGRMFPSMGDTNIFDSKQKRFSNIEGTSSFIPSGKSEQQKRYSNIETHSFESKKCMENGQVVYDYEDSRHEAQKETSDEVDAAAKANINVKTNNLTDRDHVVRENDIENNKQNIIRSAFNLDEKMAYERKITNHDNEEFRQSAKAHETLKTTPMAENFAKTTNPTNRIDQEKLFKDFDDLSQQLHRELETGRVQREKREKSASLYDLNRNHQQHLDELKRQRHEHMRELEREIERSMKSRQFNRGMSQESTLSNQQQQQRERKTYEIPVHIENSKSKQKTHDIPIRFENDNGEYVRSDFEHDDKNSPFRRAESLYNLEQSTTSPYPQGESHSRPRTSSSNYESHQLISDDWSQYASDLGSSENISRPIAREMQICYQRQQPRTIRAPRLTVSTNDLSASLAPPTYDNNNAYNVRRSQAPMMQQAPASRQENQYSSCYSVLERDPNPTYISTTSRRGVSPAPQPVQRDPQNAGFNYRSQTQPRRASLPREIHEQQLKYICSKEDELRMEFERLQNERRRLLDELHKENHESTQQPTHKDEIKTEEPQVPPRMMRDMYRPTARLPTLSEDEVFRQQMAEEWLSKVAEREERRLQKIIKISKLHEEHNLEKLTDEHNSLVSSQPDIGQEFLHRVKERRHKLHMPADSDWESGAESQPAHPPEHVSERDDNAAHVKIISGKSIAGVHELPSHLKEFARFSNQHTEQLDDSAKRHFYEEEENKREVMPNSSSSANKKASVVKTVKISRQPPQVLAPGQGECISIHETACKKNSHNASASAIKNHNHAFTSPSTNNNTPLDNLCNLNSSTNQTPTTSTGTGSILGTALVIGLGVLGAWSRLT